MNVAGCYLIKNSTGVSLHSLYKLVLLCIISYELIMLKIIRFLRLKIILSTVSIQDNFSTLMKGIFLVKNLSLKADIRTI